MKHRTGKVGGVEKHLGKSVGSSRKRNMKRAANKIVRQQGKKSEHPSQSTNQ